MVSKLNLSLSKKMKYLAVLILFLLLFRGKYFCILFKTHLSMSVMDCSRWKNLAFVSCTRFFLDKRISRGLESVVVRLSFLNVVTSRF